jgi:hypothetical protein
MIAVGADPSGITSGGNSALSYLTAQQASNGHFRYSNSSDQTPIWVTAEALVAAAGDALPISPPPREKKSKKESSSTGGSAAAGVGSGSPVPSEPLPEANGGAGGAPGAASPPGSNTIPLPGAKGGGESPEGGAGAGGQASGVLASQPVTATGTAPSPWIPIGIGLAAASLAIAAPWWFGRRNGW